ncbi:MAG TPA: nucleotide exchange factor GrpE [Candidatus Polarisedimenticolaceae bacterium]|nr:nucleotide exchange factor GrpE [Candidatus Polarisedimenticolaceae bacterium]
MDGEDPKEASDDVAGRVATLERDLATAREEARQNHDRWLRERADLENVKKRAARERTETVKFANEQVLRDLLPIVDNLERALQHARGGGDGEPLIEGVALILKSILDVLDRHGVRRIEAEGTPFDPAHHEAMAHVESAEHEPNVVVAEHQPGYRLNDRLLRPALVSVAKPPRDSDLAKDRDGD